MINKPVKSVVFDVDLSLINEKYEFTIPLDKFKDIIEYGKSKNLSLSLNSNRGRNSVLKIYNELGFNGVIIGEGGAYWYDPRTDEKASFADKFDRNKLVNSLKSDATLIDFVDTDEVIKRPELFVNKEGLAVYCEQSREYTMTLYPRVTVSGTLQCSKDLLEKVAKITAPTFPNFNCATDTKYNNILLTPRGVEKGSLLERMERPIASFGDSSPDISMFERSDFCGCPSNATPEVIKKVNALRGFVATRSYTEGAYDFLIEVIKKC